ncbi:MAG: PEP-CTERM sorting domain-containing protein [Verrucomicrobia bacterium]|nr:PEP-CTERM sorting domain-containing protein [Verrucomicrobiota bacterium]
MKKQLGLLLSAVFIAGTAFGQFVRLDESSFTASASTITFSEFGLNTVNPSYTLSSVDLGNVDVDFEGYFAGQSQSTDPITGLDILTGSPTGPLALDSGAPNTFITTDGANPTSPVLSGSPTFNGPIAILFSKDVNAVGLDGGFFDNVASMSITAYKRDGSALGSVTNNTTGIEFFGLADSSGVNSIAGVTFSITGNEPAGYAIDNLTFGSTQVLVDPVIPEPSTYAFLGMGTMGLLMYMRRRRRSKKA